MEFIPNGNRLLVKAIEEEQQTTGGFILPTKERWDLSIAEVIAVGEGVENCYDIEGRNAYFKEGDGVKVCLEGENYIIIDNDKVLGFL